MDINSQWGGGNNITLTSQADPDKFSSWIFYRAGGVSYTACMSVAFHIYYDGVDISSECSEVTAAFEMTNGVNTFKSAAKICNETVDGDGNFGWEMPEPDNCQSAGNQFDKITDRQVYYITFKWNGNNYQIINVYIEGDSQSS